MNKPCVSQKAIYAIAEKKACEKNLKICASQVSLGHYNQPLVGSGLHFQAVFFFPVEESDHYF